MSVPRIVCDRCHAIVPRDGHYVLKIEVYADPSMPEMHTADLDEVDVDAKVDDLLAQMERMTDAELQDAIYKRFDFRLCGPCHRAYLRQPLSPAE